VTSTCVQVGKVFSEFAESCNFAGRTMFVLKNSKSENLLNRNLCLMCMDDFSLSSLCFRCNFPS
jgi:hypothetical protein